MWFGVLGRLEVRRGDGTPLSVTGPARRQVLAALLARPGALVPATTLIDDLWGTAVPRSAMGSLRSHVTRLRDDLGREEAGALLMTEGDGYRLAVGPEDLDVKRFEGLLAEAAQLPDREAAVRRYDEALSLWRDEAYVEFGDAPFAVAERVRLAELRAFARERRTDLALESGRAAELVGELEARVLAEPYRERGWEQLALAFYRAGRQADALAACRRARDVLVEDLGVDAGPGLQELETRILRQDPELVAARQVRPAVVDGLRGRCPYLGLGGYEESDAALFVGRERLTAVLASRLSDQSVVLVTGASGVGKSSLVRAGLVPALRAGALPGSASWRIDVQTPITAAELLQDGSRRRPDLLILDQAEELFTSLDRPSRDELVERLTDFVDRGDGSLVIVLRSDFYGRLADVEALARFAHKSALLVGPMREDELRRAVVEPAAAAGLQLEDELIETVLDDVAGQPEPLPLLSEAMVRTWQRRQDDLLTLEGYRLAGAVAGALEAAAEECYSRMTDAQRLATRHLLVRMATRSSSGWIRRPATRGEAASGEAAESEALAALIKARLVVAHEQRIEVTHDALLHHWPRLRDWLEERTLAADLLLHLDQAATEWRAAGRQDADLYRGPRLSAASDWRDGHPEDLSPAEREFLDASARAADSELQAARAQTVREARGRRNLRRVAVALGAALVLAVAGTVVAIHERGTARTAARTAERNALVADARRLAALSATAPDIATSSLLAVASYRLQDSPDTRAALLNAVERSQSALWRIQFTHRPQVLVASPDGTRLAVSDNRRQAMIIDPRSRREIASFPAIGLVCGMTADDRQVVVFGGTSTGIAAAYDLPSGREHVITEAGDADQRAVMTSDGRWLAVPTTHHVGARTLVDLFDSRDWAARPRHFLTPGPVATLADGRTALGVEAADGSVEVRALPSLRVLGRLPAAAGDAVGIAVSPDGRYVARVDPGESTRALIYRSADPSGAGTPLPAQATDISQLAFAPDGGRLAVASGSGTLAVYRSPDGGQGLTLAGHAGALQGLAWTGTSAPTGLYSVGFDDALIAWDLATGPRTVRESGPALIPTTRAERFGSLVVGDQQLPDESDTRRLLYSVDVRTGRYVKWLAGMHEGEGINQVVSSRNGRLLLVSMVYFVGPRFGQNRIEIFDLRTHRDLGRLALPRGTENFDYGLAAAISPDARFAYSSLGRNRIGVFALPSGRYLRSYTVRFADPDGGRIVVIPWQFDPAGRLIVGGSDSGPDGGDPWSKAGPPLPPDQRLALLDPGTGRLLAQTRLGDVSYPTALAWTRDGATMAVGTYNGTLTLYRAATFRRLATGGVVDPSPVRSVDFAADGHTLVSGGATVRFWSVPSLTPEGAGFAIADSFFSGGAFAWYDPSGEVVGFAPAAGADPGTGATTRMRWFTLASKPSDLVRIACQLAGSDITHSEWSRYVGDRPYRHVCT